MAITKNSKHNRCKMQTNIRTQGPHYAELRCRCHDVWIQWLSKSEYQQIRSLMSKKPKSATALL
jgi:hypothetical protein